tara:strand:- start:198 stop:446 length:249 start_codon:yes stop_codon:yes gene_type:complete
METREPPIAERTRSPRLKFKDLAEAPHSHLPFLVTYCLYATIPQLPYLIRLFDFLRTSVPELPAVMLTQFISTDHSRQDHDH